MTIAGVCKITTTPNIAQASAVVAPANARRLGFSIWNNGANSAYICFSATANSSTCQYILPSFTSYTWPFAGFSYAGPISAIRNAGTGTLTIAEFQE